MGEGGLSFDKYNTVIRAHLFDEVFNHTSREICWHPVDNYVGVCTGHNSGLTGCHPTGINPDFLGSLVELGGSRSFPDRTIRPRCQYDIYADVFDGLIGHFEKITARWSPNVNYLYIVFLSK
jgi:hypothetical protein